LQVPWEQAYTEKDRKLVLFACDNVLTELWDEADNGYHFTDSADGTVYLVSARDPGSPNPPLRETIAQLKLHLKKFRGLFRATISIAFGSEREAGRLELSRREAIAALDQAG